MLSQFKSLSHSIQGVEAFFRYLMIDVMLAAPNNKDKEFASVISDEYRKFFKFERRKPLIFTTKAKALYQSSKNLSDLQVKYLQPIITQYFIDNKSEIWLLFLIAHSKR